MPPNMDEVLLPPHPGIVPSPAESSNEEPAFGRVEVHIEEYQGDPFPITKLQNTLLSNFTVYRHKQAPLKFNII